MLRIKDVRKKYVTGELEQTALDGVSLNLRESELVAILGPSGSGKSTLLNVIGGLDQYDSGDLIIDGISTKNYSDRDWDSYRNHTVGFVFQSYNLIPHQTVLANVELALTISGVSRKERRSRAVQALEQVGLGNQLHKKPNQMSGGQMQRVAIARALVNNPSILLADEPTGALDSETSVQVMELLKEVSKDRLVVMVTHNPELAQDYASRIVRVKDGRIMDDSNPYEVEDTAMEPPQHKNMGKSSMSFLSALILSFNNLKSKKGRTLLTAFAGSIGIIGIALIMALSAGFQTYIDQVQADTMADNPLTLQSETANMMSMIMPQPEPGTEGTANTEGHIEEQPSLSNMLGNFGANDLGAFKAHLEAHYDEIGHTLNSVQYQYNIQPRIFITKPSGVRQVNPSHLFKDLTGNELIAAIMDVNMFQQMPDDPKLLNSQFQVLEGRWPEKPDEVVFVLPDAHSLSDHAAYTLGLKELDSLQKMVDLLTEDGEIIQDSAPMQWTYEELMSLTFQLVSVPDLYRYNEEYQVWEDMSDDKDYLSQVVESSETLQVVGIVCPLDGKTTTALSPGIAYSHTLTEHIIEKAADSRIVRQQLADESVNVFTGKGFDAADDENTFDFKDLISIDGNAMSSAFGVDVNEDAVMQLLEQYLQKMEASSQVDTAEAQKSFISAQTDFIRQMLTGFMAQHSNPDGTATLHFSDIVPMVDGYFAGEDAAARIRQLADAYSMEPQDFLDVYKPLSVGLISEYIAKQMQSSMPSPDALPAVPEEAVQETEAESTLPSAPQDTVPELTVPDVSDLTATLTAASVEELAVSLPQNPIVTTAAPIMAKKMMEPVIVSNLMEQVAGFSDALARYFTSSFYVDGDKVAGAFQLRMDEDEIKRLMETLSPGNRSQDAASNLRALGYADLESPDSISLYLSDFDAKEEFINFLQDYNDSMEQSGQEDKVIQYGDMTAIMMDSVRTIIHTVSCCLIAFVAVSLVVSSIMIGIITYISVMERTREIGVLRAMGASKHNISQVFNAETFIIGLCSGLIGIGVTLLLIIPGNHLLHTLLETTQVNAKLPLVSALVLILISMLLTLLGGLIPSHQAAKKDPVIALRSE